MRKGFLIVLLAVGLAVASATALAGLKTNANVTVDTSNRFASGSLSSARNAGDAVQYIGCSITDSVGTAYVTCSARNSAGTVASCSSIDFGKVTAATAINSDSFVFFRYDTSGVCTYLSVSTYSYYPTKTH